MQTALKILLVLSFLSVALTILMVIGIFVSGFVLGWTDGFALGFLLMLASFFSFSVAVGVTAFTGVVYLIMRFFGVPRLSLFKEIYLFLGISAAIVLGLASLS